jgi:hypothetical protein
MLRGAGIAKANTLVRDAMLNPELARELLKVTQLLLALLSRDETGQPCEMHWREMLCSTQQTLINAVATPKAVPSGPTTSVWSIS